MLVGGAGRSATVLRTTQCASTLAMSWGPTGVPLCPGRHDGPSAGACCAAVGLWCRGCCRVVYEYVRNCACTSTHRCAKKSKFTRSIGAQVLFVQRFVFVSVCLSQTHRPTPRRTDTQTHTQRDRRTDRHTDTHRHTQTHAASLAFERWCASLLLTF